MIRLARAEIRREIRQDDNRKLQPLGAVNRHQTHAIGILFEYRRLGGFLLLGLRGQLLYESAERHSSGCFIGASQIRHASHVGQDLISSRPKKETRMSSGGFEQRVNGRGEGLVIPGPMQLRQEFQGGGNGGLGAIAMKGMETSTLVFVD